MTRHEGGGPAESPGFLLWHTTMRWQRTMTATLAPLDLTHVQFVLLACAWWMNHGGDAPNQVKLAAQAGTDIKMTSEVIGRLETKGLLTRASDPNDARARVITVTDRGAALAQEAITAVESADAAFFASVDSAELVGTLNALAALPIAPR